MNTEDGLYSALSLWVDDVSNKGKGMGGHVWGNHPSLSPSAVKYIRRLLEVYRGDKEDAFGLKHCSIHKNSQPPEKPPLYIPKPYIRKMLISLFEYMDEQPEDGRSIDDHLDSLLYIMREHLNLFLIHRYTDKTHYCPEWDYRLISDKSPEFSACLCREFDNE